MSQSVTENSLLLTALGHAKVMIDKVKTVQFFLETKLSYYLSLVCFPGNHCWWKLVFLTARCTDRNQSVQGKVWGAEQG